jgi:hypothetical protein
MSYFIRDVPGYATQVWKFEDGCAVLMGVTNPENGVGTYFKAAPGETIWERIRKLTPWFEPDGQNPFQETALEPGQFYPRIYRPILQGPADILGYGSHPPLETDVLSIARSQLTVLTGQLERICQTVQPTEKTFDTFGHDIRNLLILTCTEVESHWRGVLVKNGVKEHYKTRDYVALRKPMKLDEYAISFAAYPWLPPLKPYEGWGSTDTPTQELKWYDAYNAVKHDRENQFERATLLRAFEAISACVIMMAAQFGMEPLAEPRPFFHFSAVPAWLPSEFYIPPYGQPSADWSPVRFEFGANCVR